LTKIPIGFLPHTHAATNAPFSHTHFLAGFLPATSATPACRFAGTRAPPACARCHCCHSMAATSLVDGFRLKTGTALFVSGLLDAARWRHYRARRRNAAPVCFISLR